VDVNHHDVGMSRAKRTTKTLCLKGYIWIDDKIKTELGPKYDKGKVDGQYAMLTRTCYRVDTLLATRVFRMAYLLELPEGAGILELRVRQMRTEELVEEEVEAEASKKAMLWKLQHWLQWEKPRKAILSGSCCYQVGTTVWKTCWGVRSRKAKVHTHQLVVIWCVTCCCCEHAPSHFESVS
jgi:hypothetical protein